MFCVANPGPTSQTHTHARACEYTMRNNLVYGLGRITRTRVVSITDPDRRYANTWTRIPPPPCLASAAEVWRGVGYRDVDVAIHDTNVAPSGFRTFRGRTEVSKII